MKIKYLPLFASALISFYASASDSQDPETNLVFDFNPIETEYSYEADNGTITSASVLFTFTETVYSDFFKLLSLKLKDADNTTVPASFRANSDYSNQSGVIIDSKALKFGVEYTLTIPKGTYGDAEWFGVTVEVPRVSGHANSEFEVKFSLENESSGVDMITCEKNNSTEVYNLHGMKVGNSTDNLPAGIYVINGKKAVVR